MSKKHPYNVILLTKKGQWMVQGTIDGKQLFHNMCTKCYRMAKTEARKNTRSRRSSVAHVNNGPGGRHVSNTRTKELKCMLRAWLACKCGSGKYESADAVEAEAELKEAIAEVDDPDDSSYVTDAREKFAGINAIAVKNRRKFCSTCIDCKLCRKSTSTRVRLCSTCTMCQRCSTSVTWCGGIDDHEIMMFRAPGTDIGRKYLQRIQLFLKHTPQVAALAATSGMP